MHQAERFRNYLHLRLEVDGQKWQAGGKADQGDGYPPSWRHILRKRVQIVRDLAGNCVTEHQFDEFIARI